MEAERSTESLLYDPEMIAVLGINIQSSTFKRIFSKLEFLTAFSYLLDFAERKSIPYSAVEYMGSPDDVTSISPYVKNKIEVMSGRKASTLPMPADFTGKFASLEKKSRLHSSTTLNLRSAFREMKAAGLTVAFLTGFVTEFHVLGAAFEAIGEGIIPVVISDAVSSANERLHFQGLEIMSNFSFVIDSRDLMNRWGQ